MTSARPMPPIYPGDAARFANKVERGGPDECWPFTGALVGGYGRFGLRSRQVQAHRVAWVMWTDQPEPDPTLQIDHTCHDPRVCQGHCPHRACCNPAHLRPSTSAENIANSNARSRQLAGRTHCPAGHEWNKTNTRVDPASGVRLCRPCQAAWRRSNRVLKGTRSDLATRCISGHLWTAETSFVNSRGSRVCRTCANANRRKRRAAAATKATAAR